jgi:predicted TIM-barrel fold metal-dependent hydrolase
MKSLSFFALALLVISCSGIKPSNKGSGLSKNAPEWYRSVPADGKQYMFAVGAGTGSRANIAVAKAETAAKLQMARKLSEKVEGLQKVYIDETGSASDVSTNEAFTQATKTITNAQLVGAGVIKTETFTLKKDTGFEAFVLVRMPTGKARKRIVEQLSKEPNVFEKLSGSKAYQQFMEYEEVAEEGENR